MILCLALLCLALMAARIRAGAGAAVRRPAGTGGEARGRAARKPFTQSGGQTQDAAGVSLGAMNRPLPLLGHPNSLGTMGWLGGGEGWRAEPTFSVQTGFLHAAGACGESSSDSTSPELMLR